MVVSDVEDYHNFVPWCQRSVIVTKHRSGRFDAELEVGFKVFVERCGCRVTALYPIPAQVLCTVLLNALKLIQSWRFERNSKSNLGWRL